MSRHSKEQATVRKLVRLVRLNGLEYNPNRDPQVYRRVAGEPFRIQALLGGTGTARCALRDAGGRELVTADVPAPGTFAHDLRYELPGVHVVTLTVERGPERFAQDLRLDVLEHAWVG
jgi:hypothetical protein